MIRLLTKQLKRHRSGLTQAVALFFGATILIATIGRTKATALRLTPPPAAAGDGGLFSSSGDDWLVNLMLAAVAFAGTTSLLFLCIKRSKETTPPQQKKRTIANRASGDQADPGGIDLRTLPHPAGMSESAMREVQRAHDAALGPDDPLADARQKKVDFHAYTAWGWRATDELKSDGGPSMTFVQPEPLIVWLQFALENAHNNKDLKSAFLRILGRGDRGVLGDDHMLVGIQEAARKMSPTVAAPLQQYYKMQQLHRVLAPIRVAGATSPGKDRAAQRVHQGVVGGLFSANPKIKSAVDRMTDQYTLIAMLAIMARSFSASFATHCANLAGGRSGKLRAVEPKTWGRMTAKWRKEHDLVERNHGLQHASLNVDPIRVGVESSDAQCQLAVWGRVQDAFGEPLRVKNLFTDEDAVGGSKLRFVLINVPFKTTVTYRQWIGSPDYLAALEGCNMAEPDNNAPMYFSVADKAFRSPDILAAIGEEEVGFVGEVQLHLATYIVARKKTHLWFKVERAPNWRSLNLDCKKHAGYDGQQHN